MRRHGRGRGVVRDLFARYFARARTTCRPNGRTALEPADEAARARRIADFIAGMTDRYALAEHARLFRLDPGFALDRRESAIARAQQRRHADMNVYRNMFADRARRVHRGERRADRVGRAAGRSTCRASWSSRRAMPSHGDMATNAAMVLAKDAGKKPRELADAIAEKLRADAADREGRGRRARLHQPDAQAGGLARRAARACSRPAPTTAAATSGRARRSTSNTSRPIRPGRCMSAIAAARCSATRSPTCSPSPATTVTREYYINDAGAQVDVLARSAFLRYREALGEDIGAIPEGLYPGDYLKPVGAGARRRVRRRAADQSRRANGCRSCATRRST